jgi:hypothetical protein
METELDPQVIPEAEAAVRYAQQVREQHRRRTERGSTKREADIALALERLKDAMRPLRSAIGRMTYPSSGISMETQDQIRVASDAIQRERRKLWKMQDKRVRSAA